jgi:hypothetical protein
MRVKSISHFYTNMTVIERSQLENRHVEVALKVSRCLLLCVVTHMRRADLTSPLGGWLDMG